MPTKQAVNIDQENNKKTVIKYIFYSFSGVTIFFIILALPIFYYFENMSLSGSFGDTFGSINAYFSALAFAGVIVAILLQRKELELQREELRLTRIVFEKQNDEFEIQNNTLSIQRFENTFFNMLSLLSEIQNSLHLQKIAKVKSSKKIYHRNRIAQEDPIINKAGRDVFSYFSEQLLAELKKGPSVNSAFETIIQNFIFNKPMNANIQLGHYFKNVYTILKFIDETSFDLGIRKKYSNILRAQLSNDELFLLLCNAAYYEEFIPFKLLLEKYSILKHFYLDTDSGLTNVDTILRRNFQPRAFKKNDDFDSSFYIPEYTGQN